MQPVEAGLCLIHGGLRRGEVAVRGGRKELLPLGFRLPDRLPRDFQVGRAWLEQPLALGFGLVHGLAGGFQVGSARLEEFLALGLGLDHGLAGGFQVGGARSQQAVQVGLRLYQAGLGLRDLGFESGGGFGERGAGLLDGRLCRPNVVGLGRGELHQRDLRFVDGQFGLPQGPRRGATPGLGQVVLCDLDGNLGRFYVGVGRRDLRATDPAHIGGRLAAGASAVEANERLLDGQLGGPHVLGADRAVAELGQRVLGRINAGLGCGNVVSGRPGLELLQLGQRRLQAGLGAHQVATLRCLARRREANLRLAHLGLRAP